MWTEHIWSELWPLWKEHIWSEPSPPVNRTHLIWTVTPCEQNTSSLNRRPCEQNTSSLNRHPLWTEHTWFGPSPPVNKTHLVWTVTALWTEHVWFGRRPLEQNTSGLIRFPLWTEHIWSELWPLWKEHIWSEPSPPVNRTHLIWTVTPCEQNTSGLNRHRPVNRTHQIWTVTPCERNTSGLNRYPCEQNTSGLTPQPKYTMRVKLCHSLTVQCTHTLPVQCAHTLPVQWTHTLPVQCTHTLHVQCTHTLHVVRNKWTARPTHNARNHPTPFCSYVFDDPYDTAQYTGMLLNHNVERERMHVNLHRTTRGYPISPFNILWSIQLSYHDTYLTTINKLKCSRFRTVSEKPAQQPKLVYTRLKGTQKGKVTCYACERVNKNKLFRTVITFLTSVVY